MIAQEIIDSLRTFLTGPSILPGILNSHSGLKRSTPVSIPATMNTIVDLAVAVDVAGQGVGLVEHQAVEERNDLSLFALTLA